jgi:hypothetical protein
MFSRITFAMVISSLATLLVACACAGYDPVESEFEVVGPVKPSWYVVPQGVSSDDVEINLVFRTSGSVDVVVRGKCFFCRELYKKLGRNEGYAYTNISPPEGYPRYLKVSVDGRIDIYLKKEPGDKLYVLDEKESEHQQ